MCKTSSPVSERLHLEQKQAALRVELSVLKEETKLKSKEQKAELVKSALEGKLKRLQLESEVVENQTRLIMCSLDRDS